MKISEMSLEQLQDYALAQEGENKRLTEERDNLRKEKDELTSLNQQLQKRNNALFLQVEQQNVQPFEEHKEEKKQVESCEDFARNLVLGDK